MKRNINYDEKKLECQYFDICQYFDSKDCKYSQNCQMVFNIGTEEDPRNVTVRQVIKSSLEKFVAKENIKFQVNLLNGKNED